MAWDDNHTRNTAFLVIGTLVALIGVCWLCFRNTGWLHPPKHPAWQRARLAEKIPTRPGPASAPQESVPAPQPEGGSPSSASPPSPTPGASGAAPQAPAPSTGARVWTAEEHQALAQAFLRHYEQAGLGEAARRYPGSWQQPPANPLATQPLYVRNARIERTAPGQGGATVVTGTLEALSSDGTWQKAPFTLALQGGAIADLKVALPRRQAAPGSGGARG